MSVQLKDGGKYVTRNGDVVTVKAIYTIQTYEFYQYKGDMFNYSAHGRVCSSEWSEHDLISEYKEKLTPAQKAGLSLGDIVVFEGGEYVFICDDGSSAPYFTPKERFVCVYLTAKELAPNYCSRNVFCIDIGCNVTFTGKSVLPAHEQIKEALPETVDIISKVKQFVDRVDGAEVTLRKGSYTVYCNNDEFTAPNETRLFEIIDALFGAA